MSGTEFRIFGPPGCGKTEYLKRQISRAAEVTKQVVVASFTRTAAAEIASRVDLSRDQVGTLHALCFRALDRPEVVEGKLKEWNEYAPMYALSSDGAKPNMDEMAVDASFDTTGDELYAQAQLLRAKMWPRNLWPAQVEGFQRKWEAFKAEIGAVDFTDMIEVALRDVEKAPGEPLIGFFDEVQDFAPLELALVRKWARHMDMVLLAGDDDQSIYAFKGATPDAFLNPPLPDRQIRVLNQSYRVPQAIQTAAQSWIEKVKHRQPKEYKPKVDPDTGEYVQGEIRRAKTGNWRAPEYLVADAAKYLEAGKTVMFLTTCSYMLEPLKQVLRKEAIPFHNPYRRRRGDWNPLNPSRGTSAGERVLAYFRVNPARWNPFWEPGDAEESHLWRRDDFELWLELVKTSEVLQRGVRNALERWSEDYPLRASTLHPLFKDGVLAKAQALDPDWLESVLLSSKRGAAEFPLHVVRKHGSEALTKRPQVIIGTVHSVKGGEADVVYLMPDLSRAGYEEWSKPGDTQDSVRRLFYVGMTRPKETLVICPPAGPMAIML